MSVHSNVTEVGSGLKFISFSSSSGCEPRVLRTLDRFLPPSFPSLHNPLAAFAPPHHQGRHEEGDQDGHHNEGTQDAVGWVPEKPSRQRAVVEVMLVDSNEELIHQPVGPEALHL